jgi:hypothetical protein
MIESFNSFIMKHIQSTQYKICCRVLLSHYYLEKIQVEVAGTNITIKFNM